MHLTSIAPLLAASLPLASAQLHYYAQKAGLLYYGSATDSPGFREREGLEDAYPQYDKILADPKEFGSTTPTNGQKWLFTEPERGVFNFTEGEIVSEIAARNDMIFRCHALVWHSQLAPWVEETEWTPEELTEIIITHVKAVAGHWKGRCYAWDVVNEAFLDDGTWRPTVFYNVLGEEYIRIAFRAAAEADPDAKLYYNDYNLERVGPKSQAVVNLVKALQEEGVKVDGIGAQGHMIAHRAPSYDDMVAVFRSYAETGVDVALTELDVRIQMPINDTNLEWQAQVYHDATAACVKVPACVGITIWDFYDPFSWVPYFFEGEGAPLLWFEDFSKHPAYYSSLKALKKGGKPDPCKKRRAISS